MISSPYPIIKIESKDEIEQLGTKEKYWIYEEKESIKKLFKIGRENTGEDWAEVIACKIGEKIGLKVAKYELASYNDKLGTISTNFVQEDERLIHGNELLIKLNKEYKKDFTIEILKENTKRLKELKNEVCK